LFRLTDGDWKALAPDDRDAAGVRKALEKQVSDWENATLARPPLRRSEKDVDTLGDGTRVRSADSASQVELDAGLEEQLRSLGYLEGAD
jgi:hypothetical protein